MENRTITEKDIEYYLNKGRIERSKYFHRFVSISISEVKKIFLNHHDTAHDNFAKKIRNCQEMTS